MRAQTLQSTINSPCPNVMFVNAAHLATAQMHKAYDRRIDFFLILLWLNYK